MTKVRLVAASLVAALVASPVILDACLFTCHGSTTADEDRSEPSCHHATEDIDLRVEAPATACGHDHSPALLTMTGQPRSADSRCDLSFGTWQLLVLEDLAKPASLVDHAVERLTRSRDSSSIPLRI